MRYAALMILLVAGCNHTTVIQVQDVDTSGNRHTEVYTVYDDPERAFSLVERNYTLNLTATAKKAAASFDLDAKAQSQIVQLAQSLDQLNSQLLGEYKAAFFGLNSNPTGTENRKAYWAALDKLGAAAAELRKVVDLEVTRRVRQETAKAEQTTSSSAIAQITPIYQQMNATDPRSSGALKSAMDALALPADDPAKLRRLQEAKKTIEEVFGSPQTMAGGNEVLVDLHNALTSSIQRVSAVNKADSQIKTLLAQPGRLYRDRPPLQ